MGVTIFAIVILAAALHAGWNAVVKLGGDKAVTTALVTTAAAAISLLLLPFLHQPAPPSWPHIAASGAIHVLYYLLVARTYQAGDMGQTYPLMRGIAPLFVALVGTVWLGEALTTGGAIGIGLICAGVMGMALGSRREQGRAIAYAGVIAAYTLVDGVGARLSSAPGTYPSAPAGGYAKAIAARILNPNEARAKDNLPPYDGGNEFINPNIQASTGDRATDSEADGDKAPPPARPKPKAVAA